MPIVELRIGFTLSEPVRFQSFSGFAVRGFFFSILKKVKPELATQLHKQRTLAPYSTGPLEVRDRSRRIIVYTRWEEAAPAEVRITLLDRALADVVNKAILSGEVEAVSLAGKEFPIDEVSVSMLDFGDLIKEGEPVNKFALVFRTPCCLRLPTGSIFPSRRATVTRKRRYRFYIFPDPVLMARNLVRLWRKFSNAHFKYEDFLEWVEEGGVVASAYREGIRTRRVFEHPTTRKWVAGFTGLVQFTLPEDSFDERCARTLEALMRFAEHSNVGVGRTAGLGVVRYLPLVRPGKGHT